MIFLLLEPLAGKNPCFSAFLLPLGAPDRVAPQCIRQRFLPLTAGERQADPSRIFAQQRGLSAVGTVLRW